MRKKYWLWPKSIKKPSKPKPQSTALTLQQFCPEILGICSWRRAGMHPLIYLPAQISVQSATFPLCFSLLLDLVMKLHTRALPADLPFRRFISVMGRCDHFDMNHCFSFLAAFERVNTIIHFLLLFDPVFCDSQHPHPRRAMDQSDVVYKVGSSLTIENVTMEDGGPVHLQDIQCHQAGGQRHRHRVWWVLQPHQDGAGTRSVQPEGQRQAVKSAGWNGIREKFNQLKHLLIIYSF